MPVKNHKDVYVGGFLLITFKKNVLWKQITRGWKKKNQTYIIIRESVKETCGGNETLLHNNISSCVLLVGGTKVVI